MKYFLCLVLAVSNGLCQNETQLSTLPVIPVLINGIQNGKEVNIERPCSVLDTFCIRRYIAANSNCKKVYGPVPDPVYRAQSISFISAANFTFQNEDVLYKGLNGRIEEFLVNRETDKLVLAVEFQNFVASSNKTFFRFHRRAREPVITKDYFKMAARSFMITIIIPNLKKIDLQKAESFTFVNDATPVVEFGQNAFKSADPAVAFTAAEVQANISSYVQEYFLTTGPYIAATYIQYSLCNFGLKIL